MRRIANVPPTPMPLAGLGPIECATASRHTRVQTQLIDPISGRGLLPAVFDGENIGAIVARLAGSVHGDPDQVSAIPALLH